MRLSVHLLVALGACRTSTFRADAGKLLCPCVQALARENSIRRVTSFYVSCSFAYIAYESAGSASNAVATLNGVDLEGRAARVELSKPAEERAALRAERAPPAAAGPAAAARPNPNIVIIGLPKDFDADVLGKIFACESHTARRVQGMFYFYLFSHCSVQLAERSCVPALARRCLASALQTPLLSTVRSQCLAAHCTATL
jgi:hypothetical protein